MAENLPAWAHNIRRLADGTGMSQAELARRAELTRDAFNRYYTGRTRPPSDKLKILARLFNVEVHDIDPDRVQLVEAKAASGERPYSIGRARSGDPDDVRVTFDTDVHISTMKEITELLERDKARRAGQ